jgi:hypothetical protein
MSSIRKGWIVGGAIIVLLVIISPRMGHTLWVSRKGPRGGNAT